MYSLDVSKKKPPKTEFGARLYAIRKERGLTQVELAEAIDSSQRAISSYEAATTHPPAPVIAKIAAALSVTTDALLGVAKPKKTKAKLELDDPHVRKLWKKLQMLAELPIRDQRAVIRLLNSLAARSGGTRSETSAPR